MFRVVPVPGRGVGCVAANDITKGSLIFRETPVLPISASVRDLELKVVEEIYAGCEVSKVEVEKQKAEYRNVMGAFSKLTAEDRLKYLDLKYHENDKADEAIIESYNENNHGISYNLFHQVCSIFTTNTFNNGVFLKMSRFNHSCWPNAECFWNNETKTRDIVALDDIGENEEICHNYLQRCCLLKDRQETLLSKWRFVCHCRLCCFNKDEPNRQHYIHVEKAVMDKSSDSKNVVDNRMVIHNFTNLKGIRVLNILKVLETAYIVGARHLLLKKDERLILNDIAMKGIEYSHTLYSSDHAISKLWRNRLEYPFVCILKIKSRNFAKNICMFSSFLLILWNFYNLNCVQYFLLLIVVLFH